MQDDDGYAALACLLAAACMALLAVQVMRVSRSSAEMAGAWLVRARLAAAASAGVSVAMSNLASAEPTLSGGPDPERVMSIDGTRVSIRIEDESGKVPINTATEDQMRSLFLAAGVDDAEVGELTRNFFDFRDPLRQGAAGRRSGPPRQGGFRSIVELAQVPGVSLDLYKKLAPVVTTANSGAFEPRNASALAFAAMSTSGAGGVQAIEQRRERDGEQTALNPDPPQSRVGRLYTVRVEVTDGADDRLQTEELVQLTGRPENPVLVREDVEQPSA